MDSTYTLNSDFHRKVAEHEVLLSFNSDEGAVAFHEWWSKTGEASYKAYADTEYKEYLDSLNSV